LKPSVLVVDDEANVRESITLVFEDTFDVYTAATGESALKKFQEKKIDLVFLDIRMPGMDGIELLREMRKRDKLVPIVMVTAADDIQMTQEALQNGAQKYVVKPFNVHEILSLTTSLLEGKKGTV
jgi:DNA-binding response OmpR family regulator